MDDKNRRDADGHLIDVNARPSGAPDAGGATTPGSVFGGGGFLPSFLRMVARIARNVEAAVYRKLRDLDLSAGEPQGARGRPSRTRAPMPKDQQPSPV
jgi:hypothetical protein